MKILLNNLPNVEDCKIYVDFGKGYEEFNLSEVKNMGIEIPEDCIDTSKIRFKADSSLIKDFALYNSLHIMDECIDLEPNFEKSTVFPDCCFVGEYNIPDGVTSIGSYAFQKCTSLTSINIPSSVTSIDKYAFDGCTSLRTINYTGTEEQWNAITKGNYWKSQVPSDCQIVFNYVNG